MSSGDSAPYGTRTAEPWTVTFGFVETRSDADSTEMARLWRKHELICRLGKEHSRRADFFNRQLQPTLRAIWELQRAREAGASRGGVS